MKSLFRKTVAVVTLVLISLSLACKAKERFPPVTIDLPPTTDTLVTDTTLPGGGNPLPPELEPDHSKPIVP